jgi:hypothetical protein
VASQQRPEPHLQNILRSTHGIIFLGTPHHGAGLARWAEKLARFIGMIKEANSEILQVLRQDCEVLGRIQDSFHTMIRAQNMGRLQPINITCFYEELLLLGVGLVSQAVYIAASSSTNTRVLGRSSRLRHPPRLNSNRDSPQSYGYDEIRARG